MGMNVGGKQGGPMADINVTPLVDVVLVLLIIFMVVTPMLSSGVDVELPGAKTSEERNDNGQYLVVSIRDDEAVFVDSERSSKEDLIEDLNKEFADNGSRSLLIKGDKSLTWAAVHSVMDTINEGGMNSMLLATDEGE